MIESDPARWAFLVGAVVGMLLVDHMMVQFLLQFLKPTSKYAFVIGRVSKFVALTAFFVFLNSFWLPNFFPTQAKLPVVRWSEFGVLGAMALLALTSYPRMPKPKVRGDA